MLHHHGAQPLSDPGLRYDVLDTVRELEQPLPRCANLDSRHHVKPRALYAVSPIVMRPSLVW